MTHENEAAVMRLWRSRMVTLRDSLTEPIDIAQKYGLGVEEHSLSEIVDKLNDKIKMLEQPAAAGEAA